MAKSCEGCRAGCGCGAWVHDRAARCLADTRDIETFVETYQDWSWSRYEAPDFTVTVLAELTLGRSYEFSL